MGQYNNLKQDIDQKVFENSRQLITGEILNGVLKEMVDSLGKGFQFMGLATPDTNPHSGDAKIFYLAKEIGIYEHFADLEVVEGEMAFFTYDVEWVKISVPISTSAIQQAVLLNKYNPYLYEVLCPSLDYDYAKAHINEVGAIAGGCSSFVIGKQVGRNFDWNYNEDAEVVVRTAGVIGVAHMPGLTADLMESGDWTQQEHFAKLVPFMLADGVNEHGLFVSVHVVDKGADLKPIAGREEIPALMLVRYILDHCKSATEAANTIQRKVSIIMPESLAAKGQELMWFLADKELSFVVSNDQIGEVLPQIYTQSILTNFNKANVRFKADGTVYSPERPEGINPTEANRLTPYASGLERYNSLVRGFQSKTVRELLEDVRYSHLYEESEGVWYSELVGGELTVDNYPADFTDRLAAARSEWARRARNGKVWHTKHSCVYDLANKTISIVTQDGDDTISKEPINVALLGFDTADLAQAIAAEEQRARAVEQDLQQELNTKVTTDEMIQAIGSAQDLLQEAIDAEEQRARAAESDLHNEILAENTRAVDAEFDLSKRIDAIVQGRNVRDIVPNYQALLDYDTDTLGDQDIIMVLLDNTKSDHTTYYRWLANSQTWEFIGGLAFTYTKTEIDQKFADLHIVLPLFDEHSSQELLAQVDETIRKAGADAQFKLPIPIEGMSGNVTVTYVRYNPTNTYLGVFADDRSELYHITRTTSLPRTYTCEVVTKVFASADALASLIKDLYNADPAEGEEKGDIVKLNEALEGKANTDLDNISEAGKEVIKGLGGIPEAPADGKVYGRQDKEWVEMQGGGLSPEQETALNHASDTLGAYNDRASINLEVGIDNQVISAVTGKPVTKSGWAISKPFTVVRGNEYLIKIGDTDGSIWCAAQRVERTWQEEDSEGEIITHTEVDYVKKVQLNTGAELPKDGYLRILGLPSDFECVICYKKGSADGTIRVLRDGVLANICTQIGEQSGKWGVVSQTQTWASDNSSYTMNNLKYGLIPQANMDLYLSAGALFNDTANAIERFAPWGERVQHLPGYFYLNGLGDISYTEMQDIHRETYPFSRGVVAPSGCGVGYIRTRTNIPVRYFIYRMYGSNANFGYLFTQNIQIEVVNLSAENDYASAGNFQFMFSSCGHLKHITGKLRLDRVTTYQSMFNNCISLVKLNLELLKASIDFGVCKSLCNESILYMIQNAANTTAIAITLHPDAYARAIADAEIVAAAQAKNITLASA